MEDHRPLWATVALAAVTLSVVLARTVVSFARIRLVCTLACSMTLMLTITNALDQYASIYANPIYDEADILLFAIFTLVFINVIVALFLDIGLTIFKTLATTASSMNGCGGAKRLVHSRRQAILKWSAVASIAIASVCGSVLGFLIAFYDLQTKNSQTFLALSVITVLSTLYGLLTAVLYAFLPLVTIHSHFLSSHSRAYAVGVWYLAMMIPILVCHLGFYMYALTCVNPWNSINRGIDLSIRSILCLAYGLPPSKRVIRVLRTRLAGFKGDSIEFQGLSHRSGTTSPPPLYKVTSLPPLCKATSLPPLSRTTTSLPPPPSSRTSLPISLSSPSRVDDLPSPPSPVLCRQV